MCASSFRSGAASAVVVVSAVPGLIAGPAEFKAALDAYDGCLASKGRNERRVSRQRTIKGRVEPQGGNEEEIKDNGGQLTSHV